MAQIVIKRLATPRFLKVCRRHIRLCNQIDSTRIFAETMAAIYAELKEQHRLVDTKSDVVDDVSDDVRMYNNHLDIEVRNLFESCSQYDRDNMAQRVLPIIFNEQTVSDITYEDQETEIAKVEKIIVKLKSLGENHPLFPHAEKLEQYIAQVKEAEHELEMQKKELLMSIAEEELVKDRAQKQYEENFFNAQKMLGRKRVNMLFPIVFKRKKNTPTPSVDTPASGQ